MLVTLSTTLAPYLAAAVAVIWLVALIQKASNARRLDRQTGIASIRQLSWREFEQLLAEAFRRQGYTVHDTGMGADGGVDLILHKDGQQTLVQAKQWKAWKVGVKVLRELYGVQMAQKANCSILVTSGRTTDEARRFAAENSIGIIDGSKLEQMIAGLQRSPSSTVAAVPSPAQSQVAEARIEMPRCPSCGAAMVRRIARRGPNTGQQFWGCVNYPGCRGTRPG